MSNIFLPMHDDFQERYEVLKRSLDSLGYFRRGSLVRRFMPCGKPGCSCQASPPSLHGPYYQWTRKVRGKTVTVRLTREQADQLARWIATGRQLKRIIAQMERLSLRATDRLLRELPPTPQKTPRTSRARRKRADAG
jgi:hypothetical protein